MDQLHCICCQNILTIQNKYKSTEERTRVYWIQPWNQENGCKYHDEAMNIK